MLSWCFQPIIMMSGQLRFGIEHAAITQQATVLLWKVEVSKGWASKKVWKVKGLVAQSCPALCDSMDHSTPCFSVFHYLLEFAQIHVHWVKDAIQPSHPCPPFSSCLQPFSAAGSFPVSWLFTSGDQIIGASASASVLPMNIQGWFSLGFTGLISLLSKRLSRVFSSTTIWKHRFFGCYPNSFPCSYRAEASCWLSAGS